MNKFCTFTGHRDLPSNKIRNIIHRIDTEIDNAIKDGYTHFISGGAKGTDLLAARLVTEKIDFDESICLSLILPYKNFVNSYDYAYLEPYCNNISYIDEQYHISSYAKRNQKLVDSSSRIICVYNNQKIGGTFQTIKYAEKAGIEIVMININEIPIDDM